METTLTFTDAAIAYIKKMVEKQGGIGLRVSIKKTGCSGYAYLPTVINAVNPQDMVQSLGHSVTVYIDPLWAHLLAGVKVDYIEEDKSGLKQKRLVFINPNEAGRCGCGESFHLE